MTKLSLEESLVLAKKIRNWDCPHITLENKDSNGECVGHIDGFEVVLEQFSSMCSIPEYALCVYKDDIKLAHYSTDEIVPIFKKSYNEISEKYHSVVHRYWYGLQLKQKSAVSEARNLIGE